MKIQATPKMKLVAATLLVALSLAILIVIAWPHSIISGMDIHGCNEMFSRYYVDPDVARKNVPSKWEVRIHDNGKALLLVMVQKCEKMVLDERIDIGPVGMSDVWIEVVGPHEKVAPVPGTSGSLPTSYWYILGHQTDSQWAHLFLEFAGIDSQLVETISFGPDSGGTRPGQVIEDPALEATYGWTEISRIHPTPDIVTESHRFYGTNGIRELTAHSKCFTHFRGDGEVKLNATSDSVIGESGFGTSLTGFSNSVWVKDCRVDYRANYFP